MNLYKRVGKENVVAIMTEFYKRAAEDSLIGQFFTGKNMDDITNKQTAFVINMMGGPKTYAGAPLDIAHEEFSMSNTHFDRRQLILREVIDAHDLRRVEADEWIILEENFRKLIITVVNACNHQKDVTSAMA